MPLLKSVTDILNILKNICSSKEPLCRILQQRPLVLLCNLYVAITSEWVSHLTLFKKYIPTQKPLENCLKVYKEISLKKTFIINYESIINLSIFRANASSCSGKLENPEETVRENMWNKTLEMTSAQDGSGAPEVVRVLRFRL